MHRFVIIFFVLIITPNLLTAQNWNLIFSKELEAEFFLFERRYEDAALKYIEALELIPKSANIGYKVGFSYLLTFDKKQKAIEYLKSATQKVSKDYDPRAIREINAPPETYYYLGKAYQINYQFDLAKEAYIQYKKYLDPSDELTRKVDMYIASCTMAHQFLENKKGLREINLGSEINEDIPNFNAVLSGNGKTMAFTRHTENGYEVFITRKEGSNWGEPKSISSELRAFFLKTSCISFDGNELYLIDDFQINGYAYFFPYEKGSVYYSSYENGIWSKAKKLKKPINSKFNDAHISMSADGNTFYFASDRPGGLGGLDIYKTTLSSKGKWSNPENLGPRINTEFDDNTPFLTPDGKYLFFSSEGHNSVGGYDIYYADLQSVSKPINIGYPLNNPDDNLFFFPTDLQSGYIAYYHPNGFGKKDIMHVKVLPIVSLLGNISTGEGAIEEELSNLSVSIYNIDENKYETQVSADLKSRGFAHPVLPGNYQVVLQGEGFKEYIADLSIADDYSLPSYTLNILLEPLVIAPSLVFADESFLEEETSTIPEAQIEAIPDRENEQEIVEIKETKSEQKIAEIKETPSREVKVEPKIIFTDAVAHSEDSYTVQIMALIVPVDVDHFSNISGVSVVKGTDGFHRYTVGATKTKDEAREIQQQLIAIGYKDAFIRKTIMPEPAQGYFTIQIMALRNPVGTDYFINIDNVQVFKGDDGFYRYTLGTYNTLELAKENLQRIIELGYKDAFVRKVE